jgi:hypothetical protein
MFQINLWLLMIAVVMAAAVIQPWLPSGNIYNSYLRQSIPLQTRNKHDLYF